MKIAIMSFTRSGEEISKAIGHGLREKIKESRVTEINRTYFSDKLSLHMKDLFKDFDALIFVSSTGIAVRLISPHVESKTTDPAVIVVDDLGKYTISLLSGHIGGANSLSSSVSLILENHLVVTTASDGRNIDAVDTFSKRHNLYIEDLENAKKLTAFMIEKRDLIMISDNKMSIRYENITYMSLEEYKSHLKITHSEAICREIDFSQEKKGFGIIAVSNKLDIKERLKAITKDKSIPICILRPRNLYIGIGCRRGKSKEDILYAVEEVLRLYNFSVNSISAFGSIDVKSDENGLIEAVRELSVEITFFSKTQLEMVDYLFDGSDFVRQTVGVGSVSETAAYLLGKEMLVEKTALRGVTIAVSRSD